MNDFLNETVVALAVGDIRALAMAAVVVPLVVIGVLVVGASLRLRALRRQSEDWWPR